MYNIFTLEQTNRKAILIFIFLCFLQLGFSQTANFTINNASQCLTGNSFVFTNTSTGGPTAYQWTFGDGTTSTATNPTKTYSAYGTYSVQLIATVGGINYYVNKSVEVNAMPVCGFTYYVATGTGNSYSFQSTSSIGSGSMNYSWDFGDGGTATSSNPSHTYAANGTYVVTLTVTSDKGCVCSTPQSVVATVSSGGAAPNLSFTTNGTSQCLTGNNFTFTNTTPTIPGATYSWDFGDGNTSVLANPSHSYASAGTYVAKLVADIGGSLYYKSLIITVTAGTTATISGTACTGSTLTLTSPSTNISSIQWKNGASIVQTNTAVWSNTSTIVAGNNGQGTATNQFVSYATDVYVDTQGNIYVIDDYQSKVKKFAAGSTTWTLVATGLQITGVGVDDVGNLYTVDDINNWVQKWTPGSLIPTTVAGGNGLGSAANQLHDPRGNLYIDGAGNIYINDFLNNRIQKWAVGATFGTTVAGGNGQGSAANQLNYAKGFFVDAGGNIYVADRGNARISYWAVGATNGITVAGGNGQGSASNQFLSGPQNVWVDAAGNIYATDNDENRMRVFTVGATDGVVVFNGGSISGNLDLHIIYLDQQSGCIYQLSPNYPSGANVLVNKFCSSTISQTYIPTTAGTYTGIITTFGGCSATSNSIFVNTTPTVNAITGASNVCAGSSTTLANTTIGGTWSSSNTSIANVNSSGVVTGASAGTVTITYTVNNAGCSASTTKDIVVNALPSINLTGGGSCASTLTANISGGVASSLVWSLNGTPVDTSYPTYNTNAVTIAGTGVAGSSSSQLNNNTGVFVDAFGNVYVSDYVNNRVQKFAAGITTGVTVAGGNGYGSALNQLNGPKNIFVDGNGYLYVADGSYNRVLKFPPNSTSATNGVVVATATAPFGIFVDAAGSVYVADAANYQVQRWDVGAVSGVTVAGGNGGGNAANQLSQPWGVYVDAAANVYVADAPNYRIQKWASGATTGTTVAGITGIGGPPDNAHLSYVTGVYVDALGSIYTLDYFNRVMRWEQGATTGTVLFGSNYSGGNGASELYNPASFAFTSNGDIYVSDGGNNRVQKFTVASLANTFTPTTTGTYCASAVSFTGCSSSNCSVVSSLGVVPTISISAGGGCQLQVCAGSSITFNSSITNGGASPTIQWKVNGSNVSTGTSFTTSSLNNNDVVTAVLTSNAACPNPNPVTSNSITMQVNPLPSINISGSGCTGSALSITGSSIVGSSVTWYLGGSPVFTSIPVWDTVGTTVAGMLASGSAANQLNSPSDVFIDANDNIYVNEIYNNRIQRFPSGSTSGTNATTVAGGNGNGYAAYQLQASYGFTLDASNNIYITNSFAHRIDKWLNGATSGTTIAGVSATSGSTASLFQLPKRMVLDKCGNMYIADSYNHRVQKFAIGSTVGVTVAGGNGNGSAANQLSYPTDVSLDDAGNLYVCDNENHRIQKFAAGSTSATNGVSVAGGNGAGNAANQLNSAWGFTTDGAGNILVADTYNNRVMYWAAGATTGVEVAGGNGYGTTGYHFNYPTNVALDKYGNFYVADEHNNRIQKFAYLGMSSFTPSVAGTYTATVTNNSGCTGTSNTVTVTACTVVTPPTPSFTVNSTGQCITGNNFVFTNTSTAPSGTTYLWNFGDNTSSTAISPTHTYTTAGYYYVSMIATYNGQNYYASGQSVVVGAKPVAGFNTVAGTGSGNAYTFISTSTIANGSMSYAWSFGDGGTSTLVSPQHIYAATGNYNVKLVITSDLGCKDSITQSVIVTTSGTGGGSTPTPSFTTNITNQCITGNSFVFTNTSTAPSGTTYNWNFGDNTSSTIASPTHTYTSSGYFNVQMIATYNGQTYYANNQSVYVGANPVAGFNTIAGTGSGNAHTFISTSTITNGSMSYAWSFGDGGTSTLVSPQHIYSTAGTVNVKLVVTSDLGCKDSITQAVVICPTLNNQAFTINAASSCFVGNYFGVQNYFGNNAGYPMTYLWNYGDGTTSTLQNPPTHSYAAVGTYTITLTTTLSYPGCAVKTGTYSLPVTVHPMPVASFNISGSPTTMCYAANNYTFNNTTSIANGSMSFAWDFGDTTFSSLYSPTHSYSHSGPQMLDSNRGRIYTKLIATSNNGCKDSITNYVTLRPVPTAIDFSIVGVYGTTDYPLVRPNPFGGHFTNKIYNDTVQCFGGFNTFGHKVNGIFTSPYDYWQTNFDDGTSGTGFGGVPGGIGQAPYHSYDNAGVHNFSGNMISSEGCLSNTIYGHVTITPNTDTIPHSIIGLHPEVTTNVGIDPYLGHSYNRYKLFFAHLGSTACRPIISTQWRISYLSGNLYWDHGHTDANYVGILPSTSDSIYFGFDADSNNTFQIRLITMNDLGMSDTAYAFFGATNGGYTNYRAINPAAVPNNIKAYPNPATNEVRVAVKLNKNTQTNLIVYNALGQRVLTTKQYLFGNVVEEVKLNIQQLQVGTYYVQIRDDKNNILANSKFVKMK